MIKYTKEFLISELQRYHKQYDKVPTSTEFRVNNDYPKIDYYLKHWKWKEVLYIAFPNLDDINDSIMKQFLKDELKRYFIEFNKIPTSKEIDNNNDYPAYITYKKYFDWEELKEELFPNKKTEIENKKLIEKKNFLISEINRFIKEFNEYPTTHSISNAKSYPDASTFVKYFGKWYNVIVASNISLIEYKQKTKHMNNLKNSLHQFKKNGKCNINNINYKKYYYMCRFSFGKDIFNKIKGYELFQKNSNEKIVKDHIYSINDGYINNIHPFILSHPANCQFLQNTVNISKGSKSLITIEQLKRRINEWENLQKDNNSDFFNYLFEQTINVTKEQNFYISIVTGQKYIPSELEHGSWHHPRRYKIAKMLADSFGFKLGNPKTTLKDILNAVNLIKNFFYIDKMPLYLIKEKFKLTVSNMRVIIG